MSTDTVLAALAFRWCREADWGKTAVMEGSLSYDFPVGDVYGLSEEDVQSRKRMGEADRVPTTVTLAAIPETFRAYICGVDLQTMRHDDGTYHRQESVHDETERTRRREGVDLDALLEEGLL